MGRGRGTGRGQDRMCKLAACNLNIQISNFKYGKCRMSLPNVEPESIICENDENWLAQCNAPRNRDPESHCAKCCKRIKTTTTTTTTICICIFIDLNRATASKAGRGRGQEKRKEAVKKV